MSLTQVPEDVVAEAMRLGQREIVGIVAAQRELAAQLPQLRKRSSLLAGASRECERHVLVRGVAMAGSCSKGFDVF